MEQLSLDFEAPKTKRPPRRLSLSFKLSVLDTIEKLPRGQASKFIREHSLRWVQITDWRKQRAAGELGTKSPGARPGQKRGPYKKKQPIDLTGTYTLRSPEAALGIFL